MIPIKQKTMDDCFQACVASILELSIDEVPYFNTEEMHGWYDNNGNQVIGDNSGMQFFNYLTRINQEFLPLFNLNIIPGQFVDENEFPRGYAIKSGQVINEGPMKGFHHALVSYNGKVVHDPSSAKNREYEFNNMYYMFMILDPCVVKETENE